MKKKSFWIYFTVLSIAATLFHFLYDITKFAPFKLIAPINESVWEHSKILVVPFLIFAIIYFFIKKPFEKLQWWTGIAKSSLIMQLAMVAIFYTYSGAIGKSYVVCDILIAFVCVFIGLWTFFNSFVRVAKYHWIWIALFILQICAIIVFTFWQPPLAIFISTI